MFGVYWHRGEWCYHASCILVGRRSGSDWHAGAVKSVLWSSRIPSFIAMLDLIALAYVAVFGAPGNLIIASIILPLVNELAVLWASCGLYTGVSPFNMDQTRLYLSYSRFCVYMNVFACATFHWYDRSLVSANYLVHVHRVCHRAWYFLVYLCPHRSLACEAKSPVLIKAPWESLWSPHAACLKATV